MTLVSLEKRLTRIEADRSPPRVRYLLVPPGGAGVAQREEIRRLEASGLDVRLLRDPFARPGGAP